MKAAEDAPLGVLMLAELCQEFLPPGALNVLTGLGEECGASLANHPMVSKLSFTGSTEVGKLIMRALPQTASCRCRSNLAARVREYGYARIWFSEATAHPSLPGALLERKDDNPVV